MGKIPCKKCRRCGLYHDFSVAVCACGAELGNLPPALTEVADISPAQRGEINEALVCYVQKCSACGALNFTTDPAARVKVCFNCHKTRVASIEPIEYADSGAETADHAAAAEQEAKGAQARVVFDEAAENGDAAQWQGILSNLRQAVGDTAATDEAEPAEAPPAAAEAPCRTDDDDDDEAADWSAILGTEGAPKKAAAAQANCPITLTAIRYGQLSFTVAPQPDQPYLLGRAAQQGAFLSADRRVGNEHCFLIFKDGAWYVRDNHSANGTAVNARDIGYNGESVLRDGDELKLGHHQDSMAFRITIR